MSSRPWCWKPNGGVADEGCVRQCAQARAGAGVVPARRKNDHAVPNHAILLPLQRMGIFASYTIKSQHCLTYLPDLVWSGFKTVLFFLNKKNDKYVISS